MWAASAAPPCALACLVSNDHMTQTHPTVILTTTSVYFSYQDQALFSNFSAQIADGITLVRGGDGCGKSTLLRLLAGALMAEGGQLLINGVDLKAHPSSYKAQVFWTEPRADAFDQLRVRDYFEMQRSKYDGFDNFLLAEMTDGLGLQEHMHKQLFMLSTGSKRKVFLAAAFASGAAVTLLDEPFAALDAVSIEFLVRWLKIARNVKNRALVVADYLATDGLPLTQTIDLGD